MRGEADIVEGLSADDWDQVAKMPGIVVPNFPGMTTFGLKMNTQKAPTNDVNLRKAIAHAFDYDALLKIYNGNAVLQTSPFRNTTRGHIAVPGFPRQDLAKAKEFLAKSKYRNGGIELEYVIPDSTLLIFPLTMISKRIEDGEEVDVRSLFERVAASIEQLRDRVVWPQ